LNFLEEDVDQVAIAASIPLTSDDEDEVSIACMVPLPTDDEDVGCEKAAVDDYMV
jgi:hypothetical protein